MWRCCLTSWNWSLCIKMYTPLISPICVAIINETYVKRVCRYFILTSFARASKGLGFFGWPQKEWRRQPSPGISISKSVHTSTKHVKKFPLSSRKILFYSGIEAGLVFWKWNVSIHLRSLRIYWIIHQVSWTYLIDRQIIAKYRESIIPPTDQWLQLVNKSSRWVTVQC